MSGEIILEAKGLEKKFAEGDKVRPVLRSLDFSLAQGEIVVLMGRSGSGKSTLLNILGGIEPPDGGSISLAGKSLTGISERERTLLRRHYLGFIFQFFNLIPTLTVRENLLLPLELVGSRTRQMEAKADDLLQQVGLLDRAGAYPDRLSGGEQQRVAIVRALIHEPKLILADEPTGNLDAATATQVIGIMRKLIKEAGHSMLLVSHSTEVIPLADRVVTLEDGKLVETKPELVHA